MENEIVLSIAQKHGKLAAQVLIRHILQRGIAAIPKSTNPDRVASNFQVIKAILKDLSTQSQDKHHILSMRGLCVLPTYFSCLSDLLTDK